MNLSRIKHLATVAVLVAAVDTASAQPEANIAKQFDMKDGSTLVIFQDGKMSMKDKLGRTAAMKAGHVMDTKDGQRIIMIGNEIARFDSIMAVQRGGPN